MKKQPVFSPEESGQSLVELALIFTLLLFLLTGILDLGSMYYTYTSLQDTTQEGAIYGSIHPTQLVSIISHIKKSASFPLNTTNITDITVTCSGAACSTANINSCQGQKITVEVNYDYNLTIPILPVLLGRQSIQLTSTVTDTILQSSDTITALSAQTPPLACP